MIVVKALKATLVALGGLSALLLSTGCTQLGFALASTMPEPVEEVPAEFNKLEGEKVAVVVWAQPETVLQYPHVRLELASQVAYDLQRHLEPIEVVPPQKIADYQESNLNWDAMPPARLGEKFGADFVIFIELLNYSTREPHEPNLFRGRAKASLVVHDVSDPMARWSLTPATAAYPSGARRVTNIDEMTVHRQLLEILGSRIAVKFYDHEVPKGKRQA
jgi:hypothetical protein